MKPTIAVDELIIGAGLTGLMYGIVAAEEGWKVAITESHCKVGGYATNFMRNKRKYVFDCSQHKITGIGINGNLRNALERAGVWEKLDFHYFNDLTTIVHKGIFTCLPADSDGIKEILLSRFPLEKQGIEQLFIDVHQHGYQNYMFARMLLGEYQINKDILPESRALSNITSKAYFRTLFKDEELVELLSAIAIYLGAIASEANALYFLHFLYAAFVTGPSYIKGTGQRLSDILAEEFKQRGGEILLNNPAIGITAINNSITAVETRKRTFVTDKVVATCSPELVVNMFPEDAVSAKFIKQLNALQVGWGHFCVYVVANQDPDLLGFTSSEYLLIADEGDDFTSEDLLNGEYYNKLTLSVTNYHQMDPDGGPILQFIILDHAADWFILNEQEYLAKKKGIQKLILDRAYSVFPKLKGNILYAESSTPRTNFKYTNSPQGSAFGYKGLPKDNLRFLYNPPIEGLKFVGGWSTGPGYETAMCLGFTHATMEKRKRMVAEENY